MEFDKSKVFTALNADELKVGSIVICADSLAQLRQRVTSDNTVYLDILTGIRDDSEVCRFDTKESVYYFAYFVEEKKLTWTDLKLGDKLRKKAFKGYRLAMVTRIDTYQCDKHVELGDEWLSDIDLTDWEKVEL